MSFAEFTQLLENVATRSPGQVQQLRRKLDDRRAEPRPTVESAFAVLSRAGVIGCVEGSADSPTNLATNPAHLRGFGRD